MFKDNFIVDLLLFERKTTVNKFYALMITAGVIASGVVGCGGDAPATKKDDKKAATPGTPAKKEEGKKDKAPEVKAPEVKKEEAKKEDKAPEVKAPEVKKEEAKKEDKAPEVKKEEKKEDKK
jgi:hypothetical protein